MCWPQLSRNFEAEVWWRFWTWIMMLLKSNYFGERTQPPGPLCRWQCLCCFLRWKNRNCRMGKISYFLNCRTCDRSGDIDPYHHFCSTHLDNCGPDYWFGYKTLEEKTRNVFCVETCRIESVKLFSNQSVSLIQLQRVIKVPKLKFWNGCIRTWVEGCLHKVHYLLLSQLFCFFSSQSLKPFFESSLNQLKDQWICETTLKRAVETNACNVSIFLSIAFQPV